MLQAPFEIEPGSGQLGKSTTPSRAWFSKSLFWGVSCPGPRGTPPKGGRGRSPWVFGRVFGHPGQLKSKKHTLRKLCPLWAGYVQSCVTSCPGRGMFEAIFEIEPGATTLEPRALRSRSPLCTRNYMPNFGSSPRVHKQNICAPPKRVCLQTRVAVKGGQNKA